MLYHGPCTSYNSNNRASSAVLNELRKTSSIIPSLPLAKGSFTLLDYRRIALPSAPRCMATTWIGFLPPDIRVFLESSEGGITDKLHSKLSEVSLSSLPRPRVWAQNEHYPRIIELASKAGMIAWSRVGSESPNLRRLRDALTMSSFGVTKDKDSDRLISWPRVQNEWFLPSPSPCFPDPSAFSRLFADESPTGAGFALDVANMFHNIRLPTWMVSLFPLTTLLYQEMPSGLQRHVLSELGISICPPYTRFRPMQQTLPMGFTWAAFLGHSIAEGCLHHALDAFKKSNALTYRTITLSGRLNVVEPTKNDIVIAHIIDDVNIVMYDCPLDEIRRLQHLVWRGFTMSGLPLRAAKCTPLNKIETRYLPFIGFKWDLQNGTIFPKDSRTSNLSESIAQTNLLATSICRY